RSPIPLSQRWCRAPPACLLVPATPPPADPRNSAKSNSYLVLIRISQAATVRLGQVIVNDPPLLKFSINRYYQYQETKRWPAVVGRPLAEVHLNQSRQNMRGGRVAATCGRRPRGRWSPRDRGAWPRGRPAAGALAPARWRRPGASALRRAAARPGGHDRSGASSPDASWLDRREERGRFRSYIRLESKDRPGAGSSPGRPAAHPAGDAAGLP